MYLPIKNKVSYSSSSEPRIFIIIYLVEIN